MPAGNEGNRAQEIGHLVTEGAYAAAKQTYLAHPTDGAHSRNEIEGDVELHGFECEIAIRR